jgi:aminopeptidase-like protein
MTAMDERDDTVQGRDRDDAFADCGRRMHALAAELFPICRSLTGDGVRQTLRILQEHVPLQIHEVPSGTRVFDWIVPLEWNIRDAYVLDPRGEKIIDFRRSNLHVLGYSAPIDTTVPLAELQQHLYSLENLPDAIPYITSYYQERWGFCLTHRQRQALTEGDYRVVIDTELKPGHLTYGELRLPGEVEQEVFLSTNICHPSLANNELSGPLVTTWLAKWLLSEPRRYSYRIVFIPETIGSLTYMSRQLAELKRNVVAGFNVVCVGDDRAYSYLPSRQGGSLADRAALAVLRDEHPGFARYSFLERGSDERQYCSPGADLPVASVMRTMFRMYPEYHTSLDDLTVVTPAGLQGGFEVLRACLELIERNRYYVTTTVGEPQLGRRGLFPTLGTRDWNRRLRATIDLLAYADGTRDLIDISETIGVPVRELYRLVDELVAAGLLKPHGT